MVLRCVRKNKYNKSQICPFELLHKFHGTQMRPFRRASVEDKPIVCGSLTTGRNMRTVFNNKNKHSTTKVVVELRVLLVSSYLSACLVRSNTYVFSFDFRSKNMCFRNSKYKISDHVLAFEKQIMFKIKGSKILFFRMRIIRIF